jgi:hypothetical protein
VPAKSSRLDDELDRLASTSYVAEPRDSHVLQHISRSPARPAYGTLHRDVASESVLGMNESMALERIKRNVVILQDENLRLASVSGSINHCPILMVARPNKTAMACYPTSPPKGR